MLDALLASEELPEEYRNQCQVKNIYSSTTSTALEAESKLLKPF